MIFVNRNEVPPPLELLKFKESELARLGPNPSENEIEERVRRPMPMRVRQAVLRSLNSLFQGKCAFCERAGSDIERFRPRWRATRLDGRIDAQHYWWLANEWSNLYLACRECNIHKRNLFPIDADPAPPMMFGEGLEEEHPLLLDPCRDDPKEHLRFQPDGQVVATSARGAATIEILKLNNPYLVSARKNQAAFANAIFVTMTSPIEVDRLVAEHFPTSGYHRAVFESTVARFMGPPSDDLDSLEVPPSPEVAALPDAVWLVTIETQNFKSIDALKLSFPEPQSRDGLVMQPWLMVLGENGVGKSSLLQAVALTLMPDAERQAMVADGRLLAAEGWLNRSGSGRNGFVRLTFSNGTQRALSFKRGSADFMVEGDAPALPVLAYGSTRLLSDSGQISDAGLPSVSVRNLFDPRHPLKNAEQMLCDEQRLSPENFKLLASDLQGLLPLTGNATLTRDGGRLETRLHGTTVPLDELSGGYQSVLALAMDIMIHLTSSSFDMESAQGLVMIDEIELHLHPRWKIQIVEQLRQLFPRVRFIVSTHDPLCVQGLEKGELRVLARHPETKRFLIEQIDVPKGTRADEVLTGPWFGLQSTIDADTLDLMSRHSVLLNLRKRTKGEEKELQRLELELRDRMINFGHTRSHRAALAAAAAIEKELPRSEADPRIRSRLGQILNGESTAEGSADA